MSNLILPPRQAATVADQGPALAVLLALIEQHPDLPPAYITLHGHMATEPILYVGGPAELEVWREALAVPPGDVALCAGEHAAFLKMHHHVGGFTIQINGHIAGDDDGGRLSLSPQDDARLHAGRLAEQRHQVLDADVPALVIA